MKKSKQVWRGKNIKGFGKVKYKDLTSPQKERFNFQKISGLLADYGFTTILLSDDWNGADFLAVHRSGVTLNMQLKGRLSFYKKYRGNDLWVCFPQDDKWYIYPHDNLLKHVMNDKGNTVSWGKKGGYSFPKLSKKHQKLLSSYSLP